jgi:hypothetical protein
VDLRLFHLLQRFSDESARTRPPDQELLALDYLYRAYELGKDVEHTAQRQNASFERDDCPDWQRSSDNGK